MRVAWEIKGPPIPRWQYGFWAVALLLYVGYLLRQGQPDLWGVFGFQVVFLLVCLVAAKRVPLPFGSGFIEFDGKRLDFSGNAGGPWSLADVDSVMILDHQIQIRVFRPGRMGDEFTVRAEQMSEESWTALTGLCRMIQAAVPVVEDSDLLEARRRAKELDEDPEASCSWEEIKASLGR